MQIDESDYVPPHQWSLEVGAAGFTTTAAAASASAGDCTGAADSRISLLKLLNLDTWLRGGNRRWLCRCTNVQNRFVRLDLIVVLIVRCYAGLR